jgi:hypothetical protein
MVEQQGLAPPPPGVTPNFDNPPKSTPAEPAVIYIFMALSTLFLLMRVYTRAYINKIFQIEDAILIVAWVFAIAHSIVQLIDYVDYAVGSHMWDITIEQFAMSWKLIYAAQILFMFCLTLPKVAILLVYKRITPSKKVHYAIWTIMTILVSGSLAMLLAQVFACNPVQKGWDITITTGSCLDAFPIYIAIAVLSISTDFAILSIPVPIVRKLHVPLQQKIGIAMIFIIGSITCITSIIRLVTLVQATGSTDPFWDVSLTGLWTIVESYLFIICPCCFSLKAFLRKHAPFLIGATSRGDTTGRSGGHGSHVPTRGLKGHTVDSLTKDTVMGNDFPSPGFDEKSDGVDSPRVGSHQEWDAPQQHLRHDRNVAV